MVELMFNETRLLDVVDYGTTFESSFNTRVVKLKSGRERRNADWDVPMGQFSVLYSVLQKEHHREVVQAHMASMGRLIPFRFKDWSDFQAEDEPLTLGNGTSQSVQLCKTYTFGPLEFEKPIFKPVPDSVVIFEDGVPIPATVDYTTGIVTFTAAPGSVISWSGEYDKPVRFESDKLALESRSWSERGLVLTSNVDLLEVRL